MAEKQCDFKEETAAAFVGLSLTSIERTFVSAVILNAKMVTTS